MRAVALLLLIPTATASPLLVHVVPSAGGHEGAAVWSDVPFSGVLTDGEDSFAFEAPAGVTWFVDDPVAWRAWGIEGEAWGLRLGNSGDDLRLVVDGVTVDAFAWGNGATPWMDGSITLTSDRLIYTRLGGPGTWADTDTARDWMTPRQHRVGETDLAPASWRAEVTLYASPDNTFGVLADLVDGATQRLHLHVYELRHQALADRLVAAAMRGVEVRVLVDASPVGQEPWERHETAHALHRIAGAGGEAVLADKDRYAFHHLKVLVADDVVAVQSENWVPGGVPEDPSWGNRGWGAVVHAAEAAEWFAGWMALDRDHARPFVLGSYDPSYDPPPRFAPARGTYEPAFAPVRVLADVTAHVAPDATADPATEPVSALVRAATQRVMVQQLDLEQTAANGLGFRAQDPLFAALRDAPAPVRVLVAGPFRAGDTANEESLAALGDAVEGRVWSRDSMVLHNKGTIADDAVVVGSMNGNHHSRSQNREVVLVIRNATGADALAALFDDDWGAATPRQWGVIGDDLRGVPAPSLIAGLLVAIAWRSRTSTR